MKKRNVWILAVTALLCLALSAPQALAQEGKDPQLKPKRLSSTGDSMTEAIDAELPAANHWASWANGYHGFWEWLLGLTQRQQPQPADHTKKFGASAARTTWRPGAEPTCSTFRPRRRRP
jgi:hypothetical protein